MRPRLSPLSVRQRLQNGSERMFKEGGLRAETVAMLGATEEPIVKKVAVSLLKWEDLAPWQQHGSEHIETGYRRASGSLAECLHSWTYLHNETMNIYSHVLGAATFLALPFYVFTTEMPPRYAVATPTDTTVCSTYLLGVAVCFILSTTFHTFASHSQATYQLGMKLDMQGIILLQWSATVPLIHYTFRHACASTDSAAGLPAWLIDHLQLAYLVATTAAAFLCSCATHLPRFGSPHLVPWRAALFGAFGVGSFVAPIAHGMALHGVEGESARVGLWWVLVTLVCNAVGAGAYAAKFPERWFPRRFDLFGASHQVMHVMVLCAALAYTMAVLAAFDYKHGKGALCKT